MTWRDSSGNALSDYPQPSVAVDVAVLTLVPEASTWQLAVVVVEDPREGLVLPGTFLRVEQSETLAGAALRGLRDKAGIDGTAPQQLHVFDAVDRDHRGRVLSVAHVDLVPHDSLSPGVRLLEIDERARVRLPKGQAALGYDHDAIVERAVSWTRQRYDALPDPGGFLSRKFTMYQLRRVHEAIDGRELDKDSFRRKWDRLDLVVRLDEMAMSSTVGREASLYKRAPSGASSRVAPSGGRYGPRINQEKP